MTTVIPFTDLPEYSDIVPSKRLVEVMLKQGLIEPLVVMPDGNVHENDRELFEAFKQAARSHGEGGTKTVIVCYWADMTDDERSDI